MAKPKLLKPLTGLEQEVLAWLATNCQPEVDVVRFPSVRVQARAMGKSFQVVQKYRQRLAQKGWLTYHRKTGYVSAITVVGLGGSGAFQDYTGLALPNVTQPVTIKIHPEEIYHP